MTNEIFEVFQAWDTSNELGPNRSVGYYSTESLAMSAAKGRGPYGRDGSIDVHKAMRSRDGDLYIVGSRIALDDAKEQEVQAALSKLTERERSLLETRFRA